jgi:hypothetical protein
MKLQQRAAPTTAETEMGDVTLWTMLREVCSLTDTQISVRMTIET